VVDDASLVAPLGDHRKTHIHPSKGKKRKRKSMDDEHETPPPLPAIGKHVLVGINSVTRHLEAHAARNAPKSMPVAKDERAGRTNADKEEEEDIRRLSIIILTHPKPSISPAHAHFPTLLHLSSLTPAITTNTPTRLVPLASSSDARLASALHIPRVGALGIYEGAPGAKALEDFVRENIDVTECTWIDEAMRAEWRGLNIKSEVPTGKITGTEKQKATNKKKSPKSTQ
jgi:ribonuclease P/MRP protein subunit POP3